jgi:hypothetical protein
LSVGGKGSADRQCENHDRRNHQTICHPDLS